MANNALNNKYFVSTDGTQWEDVTAKWDGVKVLSVRGLSEKGESVNVYSEQWVNSQVEDVMVTTQDQSHNDVIIRKNVDLSVTIIVSRRYASTIIDERQVYDSVTSYMCDKGPFFIKSAYVDKYAKVICLKGVKPTTENLKRGDKSYILFTIELHTIDTPHTT